ncbi:MULTISPECIES: LysR family transcriptional regulator [unclassified Avibacterium]|uniref:LysR family transcriptional regulator n=1 Tax=unclassified Avibacterium TaxID=2685287 RepID=UPI0020269625|nr:MULTISPECIES: LysR family transcriptional regulator [unclassified Avibacterium]MCW9717819.1 LysR family transcriptional regulator [Avibacterium sp. 21-599]MCW9733487.1 LysR family transcriptional regulator [Avibacterium sp. 20-15]URL03351.1 LysR family transcriptional regulator [Avibacterium sp. 20-132]
MNKLDALRYFSVASETLNFRETAQRLAVSPQVVTRIIAELENLLGEPLFQRNTRSIKLTEFGEQFLPQAQQLLADSERLFSSQKINDKAMQGIVRITLPPMPYNDQLLYELLLALEPYPDLVIDWRVSLDKLKTIDDQIDIGLRVCLEPEQDWIAHHIFTIQEKIVASPKLLQRLGTPENLQDLALNYPLSGLINPKLKRIWHWQINSQQHFIPTHPKFLASDMYSELQSALVGRTCSQLIDILCQPYIEQGKLVELFPEIEKQKWQLYLYRPYQSVVSERVLFVFEKLSTILKSIVHQIEMKKSK